MRCNVIPVGLLTDQHLIAERRELRMIPPLLTKRINKVEWTLSDREIAVARDEFLTYEKCVKHIPKTLVLGTGHMLFWTNKMKYLDIRFEELTEEMEARGFRPARSIEFEADQAAQYGFYNDWEPSIQDQALLQARLIIKIRQKPDWYRYHGKRLAEDFIETNYQLGLERLRNG